ncbi:MAG: hypothetical protein V1944_00400 [Candidatus Aenigmatarchaeota archaeon]
MKGMTFKLVADVLIALVGVWIIFSVLNIFLPNYTGPALCKMYQVVLVIPLPPSLKPSITQCDIVPVKEKIILRSQTSTEIKNKITDYIWECWEEKSSNGKSGISFPCYEILIKYVPAEFGEKEITDILKSNGRCSLENSYLDFERQNYECGSQNKIFWDGGRISVNDTSIFINYNSFFHRIEVAV